MQLSTCFLASRLFPSRKSGVSGAKGSSSCGRLSGFLGDGAAALPKAMIGGLFFSGVAPPPLPDARVFTAAGAPPDFLGSGVLPEDHESLGLGLGLGLARGVCMRDGASGPSTAGLYMMDPKLASAPMVAEPPGLLASAPMLQN
jgi:hypothetical protein